MKKPLSFILSLFYTCAFLLVSLPSFGQNCTVGSLQYRPKGDCDTEISKCCKKGNASAWGEWGPTGECKGTPCPSICGEGLYRNREVSNEEDGACCADACEIPDMKNTCNCKTYAHGEGLCNCWENEPNIIDSIAEDMLPANLLPPRRDILKEKFKSTVQAKLCRDCSSYASANKEICCLGEEPPLTKSCREWDYNATSGTLKRTGSCTIGSGWASSAWQGTCSCRSGYDWNAETMHCINNEGRISSIWRDWHCSNPQSFSGTLKVGDTCYPKGSTLCYITQTGVYALVNCD